MANKNNATCSICGKEYHACLSCHDSIKANPWKVFTDTSEHYKVFQIVRGYNTGVYTKDEARVKLKNVNLDDINSFMPNIKKIIKDVIKEEKPVVKIAENDENIVEAVMNVAAEEVAVERPIISRKRNYKVEEE